jgi:folate-dependent phosphoribosylglycinamide formyltransferase PurN
MMTALTHPIRVVYFAGPYLEPAALRFVAMLEGHPEVELVLGLCQGDGAGFRHRLQNLWRRRGLLALPVLAVDLLETLCEFVRAPQASLALRRLARPALAKFETVPDVHASEMLERLQALAPDLGVIYGGPILKPEVFEIPALGTLGIHHGRTPQYRGKKTTFWEVFNGERTAGVTIQRLNRGIDTGDIVRTAEVEIGRKSYSRVWREAQQVGCETFLAAVLDMKRGCATFTPQNLSVPRGPLYKQPRPRDILALSWRRLTGRAAARTPVTRP